MSFISGNKSDNFLRDMGRRDDRFDAYGGDDTLFSSVGHDTLFGGSGNDKVDAIGASALIYGGIGNDYFDVGAQTAATLFGGPSDDFIIVSPFRLLGLNEPAPAGATVFGGDGSDLLQLNLSGIHSITATSGSGRVGAISYSSMERFYFFSDGGDVPGKRGNTFVGANGDDTLMSEGFGRNRFYGLGGNDGLVGSHDNDMLRGGSGADYLQGGAGADTLIGGTGRDTVLLDYPSGTSGGVGEADTVQIGGGFGRITPSASGLVFLSSNRDMVLQFLAGEDEVQLDGAMFTQVNEGVLSATQFVRNTSGLAQSSEDRIIIDTNDRRVLYDADGDGSRYKPIVFLEFDDRSDLPYRSDFLVF